MSDPNDYTKHDAKRETEASNKEIKEAWHAAREDFRQEYGSLDIDSNPSGYEEAFGPVAGQNEE